MWVLLVVLAMLVVLNLAALGKVGQAADRQAHEQRRQLQLHRLAAPLPAAPDPVVSLAHWRALRHPVRPRPMPLRARLRRMPGGAA